MSASLYSPKLRIAIIEGRTPDWLVKHKRSAYIVQVNLSAPPWVDRKELAMLEAWAHAMSAFHGHKHVLDHIVPITHSRVCGLTVPWNFRVVHWRVNATKGNDWCPEQCELFEV